MIGRALLLLLFSAAEALAHDKTATEPLGWDSTVALGLLVGAGALYALGLGRLWTRAGRGRGVAPWRAACFAAGLAVTIAAYASPLHALGERLFTAHMLEHEILVIVAAPLLALSRPFGAFAWGLPGSWRGPAAAVANWRGFGALARLDVATVLHGVALWAWHVPAAYGAALSQPMFHWLQHATLFGTAVVFWHAVLGQGARNRQGSAVFSLFFTALHTGMLGILLTVSRRPLYPGQSADAPAWGLNPLEDQQLAGVLMWVPGGVIYAAAAIGIIALWISSSSGEAGKGRSLATAP